MKQGHHHKATHEVSQRHGGELDIQSEPGKGSTFRLTFPAARVRYLEPAPDPRRPTVAAL